MTLRMAEKEIPGIVNMFDNPLNIFGKVNAK
jgi:hypothetical protein